MPRALTLAVLGALVLGVGSAASQAPPAWRGTRIEVASGPSGGLLADVDADGRVDLVVRARDASDITVHLGDGRGGFAARPVRTIPLGYAPSWAELGDLNGDGRADLVVTSRDEQAEYLQVLIADGRAGFVPSEPRVRIAAATEYYKPRIAFGDFDGDGRTDLLTGNGRVRDLHLLLGDGGGRFPSRRVVSVDFSPGAYFVEVADVDGDRRLDILVAGGPQDGSDARLWIKLGDGNGGFRNGSSTRLDGTVASRLAVEDLDGDGRLDVVLARDGRLTVLTNDGRGGFSPPRPVARSNGEFFAVAAVDLNRDGARDLVSATVDSVTVLLGTGKGFVPAKGSPFRAGPGAYDVRIGDLNGDGRPDIVSNASPGQPLAVLLGG